MTDTFAYILRTNEIKRHAAIKMAEMPMEPLMMLEIKPFVNKRSLQQNRAYFGVWLPAIRQKAIDSGYGENSIDEWHEYFRKRYVPETASEVMGERVVIRKTTTKLTVKDFMAYCDNVNQWCYDRLDKFQLPDLINNDYG